MMNHKTHTVILLVFSLLLAACASREAEKIALQRRCPQIFVLNNTEQIEGKVPGFERTDRIFYRVSFEKIKESCRVTRKKVTIDFDIELILETDKSIRAQLQDFAIFAAFLDGKKTPLWRETFPYQPQQWKDAQILRIRDKIRVSYPVEAKIFPRYIYFGFALSQEKLQEAYQ